MLRKRLAVSVAAAPLLFFAHGALADTSITGTRTTPITTGAPDNGQNIDVVAGGQIKLTTADPMVTVNSNNTVIIHGGLSSSGVDNSVGILVTATGAPAPGDRQTTITNAGSIALDDNYTYADTLNAQGLPGTDGVLDGPLAKGTGRYGIRVLGDMTGSVITASASTIAVEGDNSAGISIEGKLTGNLTNAGAVSIIGVNGYAIHLAGPVTGNVALTTGVVSATGKGSTALAIDGDVGGAVTIQTSISASGYRPEYQARPALATDRARLKADDGVDHPSATDPLDGYDTSLFSGPVVSIAGNVAHGILLDAPPTISTSTTLDGDGDGILDSADTDQDNDGVADTTEVTGQLTSIGGAPALRIGSSSPATPTTIGVVTGAAYALVSKGAITASGLYDGVNAIGVQVGVAGGGATTLTGGAAFTGTMAVSAFEGNATGVRLLNGSTADTVLFAGIENITSVSDGMVAANNDAQGNTSATLLLIDAGASVTTVRNTGIVGLSGQGEAANTVGVRDLSGSVRLFENSGHIISTIIATDDIDDHSDADIDPSNEVIKGTKIAVDVQAASGNVVVRQLAPSTHITTDTTDANHNGVYDLDEPSMVGNVLLGAHDDRLEVLAGTFAGDMSFGLGQDTLAISGASIVQGAISDGTGVGVPADLAVTIDNSTLLLTNTNTIAAGSLTTTAATATNHTTLGFTVDPGAGTHGQLNVATANIGAGAAVGVQFKSLLVSNQTFTLVAANSMTAGALNSTAAGNSPYLYVVTPRLAGATDGSGAGSLVVDVSRRSAALIGLNKQGTAAYDAVYSALFQDTAIRDAFLAQSDRNGFLGAFDQMLPNTGVGIFQSLMLAEQSASDGISARPDPHQRYGPDSFWIQEINSRIQRNTVDSEGSDTKAFGFVAGYESMGDGGALGLTMSYVSAEERGSSAQVGEETSASLFEGGAYWRGYQGNLTYSVRGSVGYVRLDSDRKFIYVADPNGDGTPDTVINRTASSNWAGYTVSAGGDIAYEARMGRFYARPSVGMDYLYFSEAAHDEEGGGAGFDLSLASRKSSRLDAEAILAIGAEFGRDSWWRPEMRIGYRQRIAGTLGDTVANFAGGTPFTSSTSNDRNGAIVVGFSLKAGTPMSYLALEGDSELSSEEMRYLIRLVGRVMF
ncbi:MAG: autotransporter [Caulobacter sp.]|nr:autotransporter [Caulobacter sp.]